MPVNAHRSDNASSIDPTGSGRIEKTDTLEIASQHEWARLGFQKVQEDDPNHDGFLNSELISGVFLEIYKAIDADGNRQLSLEELTAAKDNPVLKDLCSKLIA
ncbi:MAG: hypothetical protein LBV45_04295 [Xanthomonadaceae bacterium]|jgi:hypothetical protein|nr:hypothetical protein [Xanthomonadaceae bacterium]